MKGEALRRAFGEATFTPAQAAEAWQIQKPYSTLNRLKEAGIIEPSGRGRYRMAPLGTALRIGDRLEREAIRSLRNERVGELATLARMRWQAWLEDGYVTRLAPRHFRVRPSTARRARVRRVS